MKHNNLFLRIFTAALFAVVSLSAFGRSESLTVQVGETFTVRSAGHANLISVLWDWDTSSLELVGNLYSTSTSATFKAKKATTGISGVYIQATIYFQATVGTVASGKTFDDWLVRIEDNSTVRLSSSHETLTPNDRCTLQATPKPSTYSGSYKWTSSSPYVATVSGSGKTATVQARSAGKTVIKVTLDNGESDECTIEVEDESTVSLSPTSKELSTGDSFVLTASASPGYSGSYTWSTSNSSVAYCSGSGSSTTVQARAAGSATIQVKLSNGATAQCDVSVKDVDVASVEVADIRVEADKRVTAEKTVSPVNATIKRTEWNIIEGDDVISMTSDGVITGKKPGTAVINCLVNGVSSNNAEVTVYEPRLTFVSSSPEADSEGVSVFVHPSVNYSHALTATSDLSGVTLSAGGKNVDGVAEIAGNTLTFVPSKALKPLTSYRLTVPHTAVANKWGGNAQIPVKINFKTADCEKSVLSISPVDGSYLISSEKITLAATPADAEIYYTIDGSDPKQNGILYKEPFKIPGDVVVKACAIRDGWYDSEIVSGEYFRSKCEVMEYFPADDSPLYNYSWATPYLKLSGTVEASNNFRRISLTDAAGNEIAGSAYIANYMVIFVPDEPLANYTTYTMSIPRDAVKASDGEIFKGYSWSFTTRDLTTAIAMRGDESVFLLAESGDVKTRGLKYLTTTPADGSFTFEDLSSLKTAGSGVDEISGGYTHRLTRSGTSVAANGMFRCGEGASSSAVGNAIAVRAGFQTSAIIAEDHSLWLCGRNDFYQLGDSSGTTSKIYIKAAENVIDVALGNGFTLYVDGNHVLWAVGRNHLGQLGDGSTENRRGFVRVMDNVAKVYASAGGYFSACITTDNKLYTWGDNASGQLGRDARKFSATPTEVMENVASASLGRAHMLAVTDKYKLYSWGSNAFGQIAESGSGAVRPALMGENIAMAYAGPNTSLVLANSGKVTGWGRRVHSNFGSDKGNATVFVVDNGGAYATLSGALLEPSQLEIEPASVFALAATPAPLAADFDVVEWESDNTDVAYVEGNGVVHTVGLGEANITARFTDRFGTEKVGTAHVVSTNNPENPPIYNSITDVSVDSADWTAYADGLRIIVESARIGDTYSLYNVQGMTVACEVAGNERITFDARQPGLYLVRSGNKVVKVVCR